MKAKTQRELRKMQKGYPVSQLTHDVVLDVKKEGLDLEQAVCSLGNIMNGHERIASAHKSAESFYADVKRVANNAKVDTEILLNLLGQREIDDVADHVRQISQLSGYLRGYVSSFTKTLSQVESLNLSTADERTEEISNDIDWLQDKLTTPVAQLIGQAELAREGKKMVRNRDLNDVVIERFEDWRGDCEQYVAEIKEMCGEIHDISEHALADCLACCLTYDLNIGRIREIQLAELVKESIASSEVCAQYHRKSANVISDNLRDCDGVKKQFRYGVDEFLKGYKSAYDTQRSQTLFALELCSIIKSDIKRGSFFVEDTEQNAQIINKESQNSKKNGKSKNRNKPTLTAEQKEQISAVEETEKTLNSTARQIHRDFVVDSGDIKERAEAISVSFQEKA